MFQFLLFLHIIGAGVWLGGNVAQALLGPRLGREPGAQVPFMRSTIDLGLRLYTPAAVLVLLTGIGMVITSDYEFESAFVVIGFLMVIAGGLLGGVVFGPQARRAIQLREAGDHAGMLGVVSRLRTWGLLNLAALLVTFAAMVWRWGA